MSFTDPLDKLTSLLRLCCVLVPYAKARPTWSWTLAASPIWSRLTPVVSIRNSQVTTAPSTDVMTRP